MEPREAACHCGQLRLRVAGDPSRVSICNCRACQRRTGSAFGVQAAFTPDQVEVLGRFSDFTRVSDEPDHREGVFHFCPDCGSQVFSTSPSEPELVSVAVGCFADPAFPPPTESGYDSRRHPWVGLPESIARHTPELWWDAAGPLYERGAYAEAAAKGRELIEQHPDQPYIYFNTACCESLAGQVPEALGHLRQAIERWDGCLELARTDSDLDAIRGEPGFHALVG